MLADEPGDLRASATAVATVQEEIGYQGGGARTSAYSLEPDVAIVVDVTFSTATLTLIEDGVVTDQITVPVG